MLKLTFFVSTIIGLCTAVSAQTIQFKTYKDPVHKISFDIPSYWTIKYSKKDGLIGIPITKAQKDIFKDCFEGIVFRMDFDNYGLDTLLFQQFDKNGNDYVTTDKVRLNVPVKFIQGQNWKGIRHDNICGVYCRDYVSHAGGECQFFYFCKGNKTVTIETNGRAFDEKFIERLLSSFKFID
ncbi:hypothetical protein ACFOW1_02285 [Parasediminibacterium paludis]|uniref:Uncharacterized protein n=1 Tax=Parasediminibacterium paludis TaxID=908966 RepID=A0ABV8PTY4_9BACT